MDALTKHIEALIFCAKEPISINDIIACISEIFEAEMEPETIQEAVDSLVNKYESDEHTFGIFSMAGGYVFLTKPAFQHSISVLLKQSAKKRLSTAALETLAIIAYKQPITKAEVEQIRGVNCDYAIHKLLEKELVEMKGKSEGVGRPVLYGTSERFMDYFGINSIKDLPMPKDISLEANEIGSVSDIESSAEIVQNQETEN